jgi:hypothetical protein
MQTSRFLFGVGAIAAVGLALHVLASPDSEQQAKMREALRQAMEQGNPPETAPAPPAKSPVAPAPAKPVEPSPPPPAAKPPVAPAPAPVAPVVAAPVPRPGFDSVPPPNDEAATARAREAVRLKMLELQGATPEPTAPVVATQSPPRRMAPTPAPADVAAIEAAREAVRLKMHELQGMPPEAAAPVVAVQSPEPGFVPVPSPDETAALASEREAMRLKMVALQAAAPSTPSHQMVGVSSPESSLAFAPIQAPSSPLSSAQQAKLADLLARYKADLITAQDYHVQRAAILAAP